MQSYRNKLTVILLAVSLVGVFLGIVVPGDIIICAALLFLGSTIWSKWNDGPHFGNMLTTFGPRTTILFTTAMALIIGLLLADPNFRPLPSLGLILFLGYFTHRMVRQSLKLVPIRIRRK